VVGLYREAGRRGIDVEPVPNAGAGSISHSEEVADATEAATGDQCSAVW
jgi:4'-phosphopantetheinyl transferase EntD